MILLLICTHILAGSLCLCLGCALGARHRHQLVVARDTATFGKVMCEGDRAYLQRELAKLRDTLDGKDMAA